MSQFENIWHGSPPDMLDYTYSPVTGLLGASALPTRQIANSISALTGFSRPKKLNEFSGGHRFVDSSPSAGLGLLGGNLPQYPDQFDPNRWASLANINTTPIKTNSATQPPNNVGNGFTSGVDSIGDGPSASASSSSNSFGNEVGVTISNGQPGFGFSPNNVNVSGLVSGLLSGNPISTASALLSGLTVGPSLGAPTVGPTIGDMNLGAKDSQLANAMAANGDFAGLSGYGGGGGNVSGQEAAQEGAMQGGSDAGGSSSGGGHAGEGPGGAETYYKGGTVKKSGLVGPNPSGPDDGMAFLDVGEEIFSVKDVQKIGRKNLQALKSGKAKIVFRKK